NGDDLDAREDMIMASTIAALAFNVTRLGLAHA
ncbi:MAG: Iron-containing alcohol dehydrogenase, partial [Thermoanaerobacterium sp.]|nr:Iron-containing alcohol dehydrogenase [Thermoanaerobacterium sp.]